jgi:hypothetical protein
MRFIFSTLLILGLSSSAYAVTVDLPDLLTKAQLADEFGISPGEGQDVSMLRSTRLQIVIHKALVNETMEVMLDGALLYTWPTATGRDQWETAPSGERDFTSTPEGQFRIFKLVKDYVSREWKAPMFDAMFFNGGIAIHGTTPDHYAELGTPSSGGCVRLTKENADILWDEVHAIGTSNTLVIVTSK